MVNSMTGGGYDQYLHTPVMTDVTCHCLDQETAYYVLNGSPLLHPGVVSHSLMCSRLHSVQHDRGKGCYSGTERV